MVEWLNNYRLVTIEASFAKLGQMIGCRIFVCFLTPDMASMNDVSRNIE